LLDIEPFKGSAPICEFDKARFSLGRGLLHFAPVVAVMCKHSGNICKMTLGTHEDQIRVYHPS
jgi:hypothetical protein